MPKPKITTTHDTLDLCARASEVLRRVGFVFHCASQKSEATYYRWPTSDVLIRVSEHKRKKPYVGLNRVVSKLTFNGNCLDPAP